ncbi:MAG: alpha-E domain-containing protein, partial [Pseudomonadota bacterium]|nr:alpha-E domain-containing protein [Pseudomonadota bacterium]
MLSKVAERVYWAARYLERVESTARMLSIYDTLLFDLPRQVNLGWYNLIVINSLEQDFNERYSVQDERNVVKFLVGDDTNPSSIVTSLKAIRENIRTTRDVIPADTWELVNELSQYVQDHLQQGINRRDRHEFLGNVISACQQIIGLWQVNMPRDSAWEMLKLGQNLERADMTTRNLDAATAAIMQIEDDDFAVNSQQIIWGNVLRSLSADQPYRRAMRSSVKAPLVCSFLLTDQRFPRSVEYCLNDMIQGAKALPRAEKIIADIRKLHKTVTDRAEDSAPGPEMREALNDLQISLQY